MAKQGLGPPPVLSTPGTHILGGASPLPPVSPRGHLDSDEEVFARFEIQRTLSEIRRHSWRRIALQFPDNMLPDSTRVFRLLSRGLQPSASSAVAKSHGRAEDMSSTTDCVSSQKIDHGTNGGDYAIKLSILADTSYGSCCVDEIAAEHLDADAVVHYGRACLSPTARLSVLHVFTRQTVDCETVIQAFRTSFPERSEKVILTADVPYAHHVQSIHQRLVKSGYRSIFASEIIHDPTSPVPNRTVPGEALEDPEKLKEWRLFHISEPPTSLLLTLSSRLSEIRIYATDAQNVDRSMPKAAIADTSLILRRRYALITSLATVPIWGILINTLSVKNYLHIVNHVKSEIAAAGKKSYLFVVGKLNAAKVANFSEIGGWVVIGCWESSLVDSKDFYKPVITPFELKLALRRDEDRIWTGEWSADFQSILDNPVPSELGQGHGIAQDNGAAVPAEENYDSEEESSPPEFDLRSGKYVSQSRPMQTASTRLTDPTSGGSMADSLALTKRTNGAVIAVNGVASPAAQYLQSSRTWRGLGSEAEIVYEAEEQPRGAEIHEGRSGIARGYAVGAETSQR